MQYNYKIGFSFPAAFYLLNFDAHRYKNNFNII